MRVPGVRLSLRRLGGGIGRQLGKTRPLVTPNAAGKIELAVPGKGLPAVMTLQAIVSGCRPVFQNSDSGDLS